MLKNYLHKLLKKIIFAPLMFIANILFLFVILCVAGICVIFVIFRFLITLLQEFFKLAVDKLSKLFEKIYNIDVKIISWLEK